jgi:hypothetical protein
MEFEDLPGDIHKQGLAVVEEMLAYLPTACKTIAEDDNPPKRGASRSGNAWETLPSLLLVK